MAKDDREEFALYARKQAKALGQDRALFARSTELLVDLDAYDYTYLWRWMGLPIIQMPADIMATQEVIWDTRPDIIIETGVARGGSVLMMASLLAMIGGGKVIGIDIDIRAHNRDSIESHPLSKNIVLIEGGSTDPETLQTIRQHIPENSRVMVVLDSDHSYTHVLAECQAYGAMVTEGCYLVVADTLLGYLNMEQTPVKRSAVWHRGNEPLSALQAYLKQTDCFEPDPKINGKLVLSSSPNGYYQRVRK